RNDRTVWRSRLQVKQPGVADIVDVVSGFVDTRAALPIARYRAIDQPRVDGLERLVAEAETVHHARAKLFDKNISALDERNNSLDPGLGLEIQRHAPLAPVEDRKSRAFAVHERREAPRVLAARLLYLEHVGARLGEHQRGEGTGEQRGEIEDKKAGKRLHAVSTHVAGAASSLSRLICGVTVPHIARRDIGGQSGRQNWWSKPE